MTVNSIDTTVTILVGEPYSTLMEATPPIQATPASNGGPSLSSLETSIVSSTTPRVLTAGAPAVTAAAAGIVGLVVGVMVAV
jgi:hypothetical protein